MRVLIVSDAWLPQVNGVVTSLQALGGELGDLGHEGKLLSTQALAASPQSPQVMYSPSPIGRISA